MTSRLLRNTTALALVLTMSLPAGPGVSFAQEAVDCAADPQNAACAGTAAPPEDPAAPQAPAQDAPAEQVPAAPEAAPAPAEAAPAAQDAAPPAEQPAAPEAQSEPQQASEPAAEETAPAAAEPAPAEAPAAEAAPAQEAPQAAEPAPVEAAPAEADAPQEEATPEAKPAEETTPAQKPAAPVEEAQPAEKPAAPVGETAPAEKPAGSETSGEQPAEQPPAADQPQEAGSDEPAPQEAAPQAAEGDASPAETAAEPVAPDEDVTAEKGELIEQKAASEQAEPAAVVSDDITATQQADLKKKEERRRDDARDRRLELLGAAAVGAGIGMLIPALGGKVVEDQGDRLIVERDGDYYVRKDENSLLRYGDAEFRAERLRGGRTRETVTRRDGTRIVTIRDEGGYVLYRSRVLPNGREYVLVDNRRFEREDRRRPRRWDRELPPLRVDIPRERYIVPARKATYDDIYQTFAAPPVEPVEQAYSLRDVRESERLRDKVRRVDLDTITFDTGSAVVRQSQVPQLEDIARASVALIDKDPSTVLLVEGHTDAVGSEIYNLALSDRRAETVARILAEVYGVPPENMVVQGYGEDYLKIDTQGAEEQNRRVTLRNITPLLNAKK